jgi:hypothetical protein
MGLGKLIQMKFVLLKFKLPFLGVLFQLMYQNLKILRVRRLHL